jgi:hypothetical protein
VNRDQKKGFGLFCEVQARDALIFMAARRFGYVTKTIEEADGHGWHRLRGQDDRVFAKCRLDEDHRPEIDFNVYRAGVIS